MCQYLNHKLVFWREEMFHRLLYSPLNCNHLPKKRWSKNTRHTFLRANLSRPYCPSRVSHTKKIFWGSSCLHSSRYCHQKIHINVLAQWVYISDISYHQIHMLYHFMKKKIFVNHNLHIKTNSFLQCSSHLFGKLTQVMKRSLNHKKKKTWELSSNIW